MLKYKTSRVEKSKETPYVILEIGKDKFRISASINGGLVVRKTSAGDTDNIMITPAYSNQIEIK